MSPILGITDLEDFFFFCYSTNNTLFGSWIWAFYLPLCTLFELFITLKATFEFVQSYQDVPQKLSFPVRILRKGFQTAFNARDTLPGPRWGQTVHL
jgi:hypothetical protein